MRLPLGRVVASCHVCGGGDPWIKTCRRRDGREQTFAVCDPCYLVYRAELLIVPGPVTVTARCDRCLEYMNPRELATRRALEREVYRGTCQTCEEG